MSLLMFNHDVESVVIVTDTLATTPGGEPLMFQSKAWALPHINMAMAVTGIANLGAAWNEFLRSSAIVQDIRMVNNFAPEQLRLIWHGMLAEASPEVSMHATVYHFGFEVGAERPIRYVYRSTRNFESERIEESGFGVKPAPDPSSLKAPDTLDEFIELALRIRAEQDELPPGERIYIGGELYLLHLRNWHSQIARIHRFDDFDDSWREMITRLNRDQGVA